jgi:cytochrome P450
MEDRMAKLLLLGTSLLVLYAIRKYVEFRRIVKPFQSYSYVTELFSQDSIVAFFLPKIRGITKGMILNASWLEKHKPYTEAGFDATVNVALFPTMKVSLSLADAAAIKEVGTARARFPKPLVMYKILTFFGNNIVASEGEEWKKHRKPAAPSFSDGNNKLVWDETEKIMLDLFENIWAARDTIFLEHALNITFQIALYVIGAAGFGQRMSWEDEEGVPPNHRMTFKDAMQQVSTNLLTKLMVPDWAMGFTKRTRKVRLAFEELDGYLLEMISKRRNAERKEERYDLLSSLLDASADDPTFTDRELIGNIFIFLVAGHETTAHTLCYALGLLALYPDQQEILFQHIQSILPNGRLSAYEDMPRLTHSMAVFYEALRMFPVASSLSKYSAEDTSLKVSNNSGESYILPVPRDTTIRINIVGTHYNPRYWKDPEEFQPARFLDPDWPRDAFIPFSTGPRACIGRKFSETEGIAVLTMLVQRYTIEVKEEPQFVAETFAERRTRVLATKVTPGLTPVRVPLVLKRR